MGFFALKVRFLGLVSIVHYLLAIRSAKRQSHNFCQQCRVVFVFVVTGLGVVSGYSGQWGGEGLLRATILTVNVIETIYTQQTLRIICFVSNKNIKEDRHDNIGTKNKCFVALYPVIGK
jgi:hypothetical protein